MSLPLPIHPQPNRPLPSQSPPSFPQPNRRPPSPPPKEPLAEGETVKAVTDDFEARSAALDAQIAEELGAELSLAELGEDMDGRELADVDGI